MSRQKIIGQMIQKYVVTPMINEECGLEEEELDALAEIIGSKKMTIEQASRYLNIDKTTLRRKIRYGELPAPEKDSGGKKYFFRKDLKNG